MKHAKIEMKHAHDLKEAGSCIVPSWQIFNIYVFIRCMEATMEQGGSKQHNQSKYFSNSDLRHARIQQFVGMHEAGSQIHFIM
jgi:hypothetical protein